MDALRCGHTEVDRHRSSAVTSSLRLQRLHAVVGCWTLEIHKDRAPPCDPDESSIDVCTGCDRSSLRRPTARVCQTKSSYSTVWWVWILTR